MAGETVTRSSMDALAQDEYARHVPKKKPRKRKRPARKPGVSVIRRAMGA